MKVESIAEYSLWSILQYFWPELSDNCSLNPKFGLFETGRFTQVTVSDGSLILNMGSDMGFFLGSWKFTIY